MYVIIGMFSESRKVNFQGTENQILVDYTSCYIFITNQCDQVDCRRESGVGGVGLQQGMKDCFVFYSYK